MDKKQEWCVSTYWHHLYLSQQLCPMQLALPMWGIGICLLGMSLSASIGSCFVSIFKFDEIEDSAAMLQCCSSWVLIWVENLHFIILSSFTSGEPSASSLTPSNNFLHQVNSMCLTCKWLYTYIYIHIFIHGFTMFHNVHHFKSCAVALQLYFCGALFVARTPHRPPPGLRADPLETSLVTWEPSHDKRGYWREGTNKRNCFCARFISLNLIAIAHTWPSKTWAAAGTAHAGLLADCCRSYQV